MTSNQYALGYKAGLDAAVKVCHDIERKRWETMMHGGNITGWTPKDIAEDIAALPVPEVQWRDLTPQEVTDAIREGAADGGWQSFAERIIAKFKGINCE